MQPPPPRVRGREMRKRHRSPSLQMCGLFVALVFFSAMVLWSPFQETADFDYDEGVNLMRAAVKQMDLSARAYHRVLKMARTIADIAGEEVLETQHLAEALQYRPRNLM